MRFGIAEENQSVACSSATSQLDKNAGFYACSPALCWARRKTPLARKQREVTVDLQGQRHTMDRRIFGQFLEHFGRIIQGGLWAEILRNRKFYPIDPDRTQVADPWKPEADRSKVSYVIDRFESIDGVSVRL